MLTFPGSYSSHSNQSETFFRR